MSPLSPVQQLVIEPINPDVLLAWPRTSGAARYAIYRDAVPLFTPGPSNCLGSTTDTTFTDPNVAALPPTQNFYIVTALDNSGVLVSVPRPSERSFRPAEKAATKQH